MKSKKQGYGLAGQLADFTIFLLLFAAICAGVLFGKFILFGKSEKCRTAIIETEGIPYIHEGRLAPGDTVYDTLTKRRLGEIRDLSELRKDERIYYSFTLDLSSEPRGRALRTAKLWFYFKEISE